MTNTQVQHTKYNERILEVEHLNSTTLVFAINRPVNVTFGLPKT